MVILWPVEHCDGPLERVGIVRIGQEPLAEFFADHAGLHDRGVEDIAAEHDETGIFEQRLAERADYSLVLDRGVAAIFADGLAVHRERLFADDPCLISCATTAGTPPAR